MDQHGKISVAKKETKRKFPREKGNTVSLGDSHKSAVLAGAFHFCNNWDLIDILFLLL